MIWLKRFLQSEDGPTAVEYAVILAMLFLAIAAGIKAMGSANQKSLEDSGTKIEEKFDEVIG